MPVEPSRALIDSYRPGNYDTMGLSYVIRRAYDSQIRQITEEEEEEGMTNKKSVEQERKENGLY